MAGFHTDAAAPNFALPRHLLSGERTSQKIKTAPLGSLPSFAAQSTNGRNAENRPFAALCTNVSVAGQSRLMLMQRNSTQSVGQFTEHVSAVLHISPNQTLRTIKWVAPQIDLSEPHFQAWLLLVFIQFAACDSIYSSSKNSETQSPVFLMATLDSGDSGNAAMKTCGIPS